MDASLAGASQLQQLRRLTGRLIASPMTLPSVGLVGSCAVDAVGLGRATRGIALRVWRNWVLA